MMKKKRKLTGEDIPWDPEEIGKVHLASDSDGHDCIIKKSNWISKQWDPILTAIDFEQFIGDNIAGI